MRGMKIIKSWNGCARHTYILEGGRVGGRAQRAWCLAGHICSLPPYCITLYFFLLRFGHDDDDDDDDLPCCCRTRKKLVPADRPVLLRSSAFTTIAATCVSLVTKASFVDDDGFFFCCVSACDCCWCRTFFSRPVETRNECEIWNQRGPKTVTHITGEEENQRFESETMSPPCRVAPE
jgi:hypothetical protein